MLLSRELSYLEHSQEVSEPTWIYRSANWLPTTAAMRLYKMGILPPAFPLQFFSDKCGFNFRRKADMKFLFRTQAQKTGWKKHPCCHRLRWTFVFPLTHGRGATNPFPLSFPLLLAPARALSLSTAVYDTQSSCPLVTWKSFTRSGVQWVRNGVSSAVPQETEGHRIAKYLKLEGTHKDQDHQLCM